MARQRKVPPIIWTILLILILALNGTPYVKTANLVLIVARLILLVVLSVAVIRQWWNYQHRLQGGNTRHEAGDNLFERWRRWTMDEPPTPEESPASHIVEGGCYHGSRLPRFNDGWIVVAIVVLVAIVFVLSRR